jgi:hypothetical protein
MYGEYSDLYLVYAAKGQLKTVVDVGHYREKTAEYDARFGATQEQDMFPLNRWNSEDAGVGWVGERRKDYLQARFYFKFDLVNDASKNNDLKRFWVENYFIHESMLRVEDKRWTVTITEHKVVTHTAENIPHEPDKDETKTFELSGVARQITRAQL